MYANTVEEKIKWGKDIKGSIATIPKAENDRKNKFEKEFAKYLKGLKGKNTFRKSFFVSDKQASSNENIENNRRVELSKNVIKSKGKN